jgi:hypothetical protein
VINRKFDLDRNYRNTAEILRAARAFSVPPGSGMQGVLALPVEPDTAIRSGPEPLVDPARRCGERDASLPRHYTQEVAGSRSSNLWTLL